MAEKIVNGPHKRTLPEYDPDGKYSDWRYEYPISKGVRDLYCTDIDWVEWRGGKPRVFIETTRCFGRDPQEVAHNYLTRNKKFQADVITRIAGRCRIPAYLVVIEDPAPEENDNYINATFHVYRILKINPGEFSLQKKGKGSVDKYFEWLRRV